MTCWRCDKERYEDSLRPYCMEHLIKELETEALIAKTMRRPDTYHWPPQLELPYDGGTWMDERQLFQMVDRMNERIKELEREKTAEAKVWMEMVDRAEVKAARERLRFE